MSKHRNKHKHRNRRQQHFQNKATNIPHKNVVPPPTKNGVVPFDQQKIQDIYLLNYAVAMFLTHAFEQEHIKRVECIKMLCKYVGKDYRYVIKSYFDNNENLQDDGDIQ